MKKSYEVIGRYPVREPLAAGTVIELEEQAAKYLVLDGSLKEVPATEPGVAFESASRRGAKPGDR